MKTMKAWFILIAVMALLASANYSQADSVTVNTQNPGPTPFISLLDLTVSNPSALQGIEFMVESKPASVTRPLSASYSSAYLQRRGYFNLQTGQLTLPVFGLYANYNNTVTLTYAFDGGLIGHATLTIPTVAFQDPTGLYMHPTIVQARGMNTDLSYDLIMLKDSPPNAVFSPVIIDTDGEVRWIGTNGYGAVSSIFFDNAIYITNGRGIARNEFDGTFRPVADYTNLGVTRTHHNFDRGKNGILVEVDTSTWLESVILEVDGAGNVLKTWNMADIISGAMTAGGDDPSAFVRTRASSSPDWFHNNACTYQKSDDSLIVSSRENFVISVDYETGAIKWILGDPTKAWYQYPSLRKFALSLGPGTLPPIGQHAVSITEDQNLLLFDNGTFSLNQNPQGNNRNYSAPRKYLINDEEKTAQETWNYLAQPSIYSAFTASVYEDSAQNYLIDYGGAVGGPQIMGLSAKGDKVFHITYGGDFSTAWNAIPIHLENLRYVITDQGYNDPLLTTLKITTGRTTATQTFTGIPDAEHFISITNGTPGLTRLEVLLDGHYKAFKLRDNQTINIDMAATLTSPSSTPGTLTLVGAGPTGGSADIFVSK